jgi:hypothetical protein
MTNEKKPTRLDELKNWILNNRYLAIIILIGVVIISLASFTNALRDIWDFAKSVFTPPTPTPMATTVPVVYYALFGLQFPEGAWKEGATYRYSLEVRECEKDNFTGDLVTFTVQTGSADLPFYLLKDGVYDTPDRNSARPAKASPIQKSYAAVIIPKSSAEEAQRVAKTCQAFINLESGPQLALEPFGLGPVILLKNLDPAMFKEAEIELP